MVIEGEHAVNVARESLDDWLAGGGFVHSTRRKGFLSGQLADPEICMGGLA